MAFAAGTDDDEEEEEEQKWLCTLVMTHNCCYYNYEMKKRTYRKSYPLPLDLLDLDLPYLNTLFDLVAQTP